MNRIYQVASKGTRSALSALKSLDKRQLDIVDQNGNTAVCQAILSHNYKAFNLLKQAGANLRAPCVRNISPEELQAFNRDYAVWARSVAYSPTRRYNYRGNRSAQSEGLSPLAWAGIGIGAVALIGGGIAIAASGGGSSKKSSSNDSGGSGGGGGGGGGDSQGSYDDGSSPIGNTIALDSSNPASYRTTEFQKGNFLSQINADKAYARGFGGYEVNGDGSRGPAVKVGVLDGGTDINNPDLSGTIVTNGDGKRYGYNFDYGPCRGSDRTHCYAYSSGYLIFYNTGAGDYDVLGTISSSNFSEFSAMYPSDYDWDTQQNNPFAHHIGSANTDVDSYSNAASNDHGTHTAGIVGANMNGQGMHGVAPYAQIVPGVFDPFGEGFERALKTYADEGVRVINMSFGVTTTSSSLTVENAAGKTASGIYMSNSEIEGHKIAAQNNIVLVRAAGNEGNGYSASIDNGVPLTTTFGKGSAYDMTNLFITVVSATSGNSLTEYSQTCGAAQGYCLTAPGGDLTYKRDEAQAYAQSKINDGSWSYDYAVQWFIQYQLGQMVYSTVQADNNHSKESSGAAYGYMEGTSMATPVVTGSVALLMGAYPYLTSQQVVEILFMTANKDLVGWTNDGTWTYTDGNNVEHTLYTSHIFGHGMVDLDKATQPIGTLDIPTGLGTGGGIPLATTKLLLPSIFQKQTLPVPERIIALDDYKRAFIVPFDSVVKVAHHNPETFKKAFRSFMATKRKTIGAPDKLSFSFTERSVTDDSLMGMGAVDMRLQLTDQNAMTFSYRSDVLGEERHFDQALANPFLDMRESYGLSHTYNMNKKWAFSFGAKTGRNGFFEGDKDLNEEYNRSMQAFTSEIAYHPFNHLTLRAVGGMVNEKGAILGINGSGAFDTNTSKTYFTGAVVEYTPVKPLTLSVAYYYGRSEMPKTNSLLSFSPILSDSFAFDTRYHLDSQKMLGLQFSSPLRIRRGTATLDIPVGRDMYSDTVYREQWDASLKPTAREYDVGLYYTHETDNYDWRGEFMTRFHPDHIADAQPDYRALFGVSFKY